MQSLRRHPVRRALATRPLRVCGPRLGLSSLRARLPLAPVDPCGVRRLLRDRLPAARQRLPRPPDRRRDGAGRAAHSTPRSSSSSCGSRCLRPRRACSTSAARRASSPAPSGTRSEPPRPCSIPRPTSSPMPPRPGWRPLPASPRTPTTAPGPSSSCSSARRSITCSTSRPRSHAIRSWLAPGGLAFVDVLDVGFMLRRRGSIEGASRSTIRTRSRARRRSPTSSRRASRRPPSGSRTTAIWASCSSRSRPREPVWAELAEAAEKLRRRALAVARALDEILAVVPARSGSQRLPRKNLATLEGRSLVRRALDTALAAGCFDCVALTSDTDEILAEAEGLQVASRATAGRARVGSTARTFDVVSHALAELERAEERFDAVAVVQATSPFTAPEDLAGARRAARAERSGLGGLGRAASRQGSTR